MRILNMAIATAVYLSSCANTSKLPPNQGIKGRVVFSAGNRMPSPDVPSAKPRGMKTTLYVYELTNLSQVTRQETNSFYTAINTKLVGDVNSGTDGSFKINLPPGKYSLFVKKDTLFYANWFDEKGNIAPVEVVANKLTDVEFKVDYNATY